MKRAINVLSFLQKFAMHSTDGNSIKIGGGAIWMGSTSNSKGFLHGLGGFAIYGAGPSTDHTPDAAAWKDFYLLSPYFA